MNRLSKESTQMGDAFDARKERERGKEEIEESSLFTLLKLTKS